MRVHIPDIFGGHKNKLEVFLQADFFCMLGQIQRVKKRGQFFTGGQLLFHDSLQLGPWGKNLLQSFLMLGQTVLVLFFF